MDRKPELGQIPRMAGEMRKARNAARRSLEDVAAAIDISASQLSRYETGAKSPRLDELYKIADYLGVRVIDLIEEEGPHPREPLLRRQDGHSPIDLGTFARLLDKAHTILAGQALTDEELLVLLEALIEDSRTPLDDSIAASEDDQYSLRASAIVRLARTTQPR